MSLQPSAFAKWFTGSEATLERWLSESAPTKIEFTYKGDNCRSETLSVKRDLFKGIYYRLPVRCDVAASNTTGDDLRTAEMKDQVVPQLGPLSRVAIESGTWSDRSVMVGFDDFGQISSYRFTSTAVAKDLATAGAATAKQFGDAEQEGIDAELELLTKKKDLIDARKALRQAEQKR